jgi:hypothetical protein
MSPTMAQYTGPLAFRPADARQVGQDLQAKLNTHCLCESWNEAGEHVAQGTVRTRRGVTQTQVFPGFPVACHPLDTALGLRPLGRRDGDVPILEIELPEGVERMPTTSGAAGDVRFVVFAGKMDPREGGKRRDPVDGHMKVEFTDSDLELERQEGGASRLLLRLRPPKKGEDTKRWRMLGSFCRGWRFKPNRGGEKILQELPRLFAVGCPRAGKAETDSERREFTLQATLCHLQTPVPKLQLAYLGRCESKAAPAACVSAPEPDPEPKADSEVVSPGSEGASPTAYGLYEDCLRAAQAAIKEGRPSNKLEALVHSLLNRCEEEEVVKALVGEAAWKRYDEGDDEERSEVCERARRFAELARLLLPKNFLEAPPEAIDELLADPARVRMLARKTGALLDEMVFDVGGGSA